jgi:hypothetical protein
MVWEHDDHAVRLFEGNNRVGCISKALLNNKFCVTVVDGALRANRIA